MTAYLYKYDLARAYFPNVSPRTAARLFRREVQHCRPLWQALQASGYSHSQKRLSPLQVQLVFQFLGEP